jgi:CBS domain-containing protein
MVTSRGVEQALAAGQLDAPISGLLENTPAVTTEQTLEQALAILLPQESPGLPVLDAEGGAIVGWLDHRAVLLAYQARLSGGAGRAPPRAPSSAGGDRSRQPEGGEAPS